MILNFFFMFEGLGFVIVFCVWVPVVLCLIVLLEEGEDVLLLKFLLELLWY